MKKYLFIFLVLVAAVLAVSCGSPKNTAKSAVEKNGVIILVDKGSSRTVDLIIDKGSYEVKTVNENDIKKNLKKAADAMIYVTPSRHDICVRYKNKTIYEDRIHVRGDDTKMIRLK